MAKDIDRHAWLKPALAQAGHLQKDLAFAWDVDQAVVSRFIKTGEPALTFDRAQALCRMLGISLDELNLRLQEGLPIEKRPSAKARAAAHPTPLVEATIETPGTDAAMANLNNAVLGAIKALGVRNIKVVLDYGDIAKEA